MKAKWRHPRDSQNYFEVDILKFINDGYAIIRKPDGWLDMTLVDSLRVLDGEQDDRQS